MIGVFISRRLCVFQPIPFGVDTPGTQSWLEAGYTGEVSRLEAPALRVGITLTECPCGLCMRPGYIGKAA
ncbi:MAG: hypothetical protein WCP39_07930 [Chlamydiota bacterium]